MFEYKVLTVKINPGFDTPKIDDVEIEKAINKLGADRWELVNVVPNASSSVPSTYTFILAPPSYTNELSIFKL